MSFCVVLTCFPQHSIPKTDFVLKLLSLKRMKNHKNHLENLKPLLTLGPKLMKKKHDTFQTKSITKEKSKFC